MANEIGATGSRMLMANLRDREVEDRANQRRNSALAAMQADNLNRMAMDPDINDKSLSYFAAAQQADPSGIMGRIAGALGTVRGMEAQEKKNQAVADRRQRTNEYMGSALEGMFGRDLTDIEQAMVDDGQGEMVGKILRETEDYKYKQTLRNRQMDEFEREDAERAKNQKRIDNLQSVFNNRFLEKLPENVRDIYRNASPEMQEQLLFEEATKTMGEQETIDMIKDIAPQLIERGYDPALFAKVQQGKLPLPVFEFLTMKADAMARQEEYFEAQDEYNALTEDYGDRYIKTYSLIKNSLVSDEGAIQALIQQGKDRNLITPEEVASQRQLMIENLMLDEKIYSRVDEQTKASLSPFQKRLQFQQGKITRMIQSNPMIAESISFKTPEFMNQMLPNIPEGRVFQAPNGNWKKVEMINGQKSLIDAPMKDIERYQSRFDPFMQNQEEVEEQATPAMKSPPLPAPSSVGESPKQPKQPGSAVLKAMRQNEARQEQEKKALGMHQSIERDVMSAAKELQPEGHDYTSLFNFDRSTIGYHNAFSFAPNKDVQRRRIAEGKNPRFSIFRSPDKSYNGYMNYKTSDNTFSKPISVPEFIDKLKRKDAAKVLDVSPEYIEIYRKIFKLADEKHTAQK